MKKNCPGCKALRDKAAKPRADIGDLLLQAALHEASSQCRDKQPAAKTAEQKQG
ncbi:hypothetical protein ACFYOD_35950 [Streptomyces sp. NPDC006703]|uniref:hypothetical protein n=1 Tax=Streptomyces sp. NPDC006703 TaxID=3364759 RepID=UPI00367ECB2A